MVPELLSLLADAIELEFTAIHGVVRQSSSYTTLKVWARMALLQDQYASMESLLRSQSEALTETLRRIGKVDDELLVILQVKEVVEKQETTRNLQAVAPTGHSEPYPGDAGSLNISPGSLHCTYLGYSCCVSARLAWWRSICGWRKADETRRASPGEWPA